MYETLLDILHDEGKLSLRVPDEGDDEEWVEEMPFEDLVMLVERANRQAGGSGVE